MKKRSIMRGSPKKRGIVTLCVVALLIVVIGLLAINGVSHIFGTKYSLLPVYNGISLGLDLRGGIYAVYLGDTSATDFDAQMDATVTIIRTRLTNEGFTEATVTRQGDDRIRVEIPDVQDPNAILDIIGTPAHLTFVDPDGNVILEGDDIQEAKAAYLTEGNEPVVTFKLSDEGAKIFAEETAAHINQIISIKLDGEDISTPTVQTAITGGSGYIEGMSSIAYAQTLAGLIMSGALPLDIQMIEVSAISATLGDEALSASLIAGIIGVALVMLFMLVMYRLPGLMADLALCIYMLVVFYALAFIPGVQLTLPGIAGILLGVGMAVDANVIIFERFREELKSGRSIDSAATRGFKNALSAIIDSNVTTIIAGLVLMYFGTGPIKGFAVTLTIGVVVSMLTAVFVTRFLMKQAVRLNLQNKALYTR